MYAGNPYHGPYRAIVPLPSWMQGRSADRPKEHTEFLDRCDLAHSLFDLFDLTNRPFNIVEIRCGRECGFVSTRVAYDKIHRGRQ